MSLTLIEQAAQGINNKDMFQAAATLIGKAAQQIKWIETRSKQAAPQALIVAD